MSAIVYWVIGIYLALMVIMGAVFKHSNKNTGDYFRSGSRASWWLVGTSNFISGISAYTFTVAAGIAFSAGWSVVLSFATTTVRRALIGWLYMPLCRQKRLTTGGEVVRERFNPVTQQTLQIIGLLTGYIGSGIGLYTLGIFVSSIFGISIYYVIIALGAVVVFYSVAGGRWAVMATDFLQCVVMMSVTFTVTILCFVEAGGFGAFFGKIGELGLTEQFSLFKTVDSLKGTRYEGYFTWQWLLALNLWAYVGELGVSRTFYVVKDGREAVKSQLLFAGLTFFGAAFFFIPAFMAKFYYADQVKNLALKTAEDGAYAVTCLNLLPESMIGLVVVAMFAAAMSTMDTSLNGGAASFMLNIYPPLERILKIRPRTEKEKLFLSECYSAFAGMICIGTALLYAYKGVGAMNLLLGIGAYIGLPMAVPMFWGLFLRKMPQWVPLGCLPFGFVGSFIMWILRHYAIKLTYLETVTFNIAFPTLVVFFLCWVFRRTNNKEYLDRVDAFFKRMHTPVDFEKEVGGSNDSYQLRILGSFCSIGGTFIMLLTFFGKDARGVLCPLCMGGAILILGLGMYFGGRYLKKKEEAKCRKTD